MSAAIGYRDGGIGADGEFTLFMLPSRNGEVGFCEGTTVGGDVGLLPVPPVTDGVVGSPLSCPLPMLWDAAAAAAAS